MSGEQSELLGMNKVWKRRSSRMSLAWENNRRMVTPYVTKLGESHANLEDYTVELGEKYIELPERAERPSIENKRLRKENADLKGEEYLSDKEPREEELDKLEQADEDEEMLEAVDGDDEQILGRGVCDGMGFCDGMGIYD